MKRISKKCKVCGRVAKYWLYEKEFPITTAPYRELMRSETKHNPVRIIAHCGYHQPLRGIDAKTTKYLKVK